MSSSGPGSARSLEVPSLRLNFDESKNIDRPHAGWIPVPYEIMTIPDDVYAEMKKLADAQAALEEAKARYEKLRGEFYSTKAGEWVTSYVAPTEKKTVSDYVSDEELAKMKEAFDAMGATKFVPKLQGYAHVVIDVAFAKNAGPTKEAAEAVKFNGWRTGVRSWTTSEKKTDAQETDTEKKSWFQSLAGGKTEEKKENQKITCVSYLEIRKEFGDFYPPYRALDKQQVNEREDLYHSDKPQESYRTWRRSHINRYVNKDMLPEYYEQQKKFLVDPYVDAKGANKEELWWNQSDDE